MPPKSNAPADDKTDDKPTKAVRKLGEFEKATLVHPDRKDSDVNVDGRCLADYLARGYVFKA